MAELRINGEKVADLENVRSVGLVTNRGEVGRTRVDDTVTVINIDIDSFGPVELVELHPSSVDWESLDESFEDEDVESFEDEDENKNPDENELPSL